jgi:hypothetical protein
MDFIRLICVVSAALALVIGPAEAQFTTSTFGGGGNTVPSFVPQFGGMQTTTPMTIGRSVNGAAAAQAAAEAASGAADTQPNSPHNHMQWHGLTGYNGTGIAAGTGSLNFTTTWTENSAGQTPDLDSHVLLAPGYGPYTVSGGQSPFGVNTATRPWPYGSAEFERNVYYVQPTITFAGATATFSGDVDGSTTLTGNCARSGGACEEVRITGTVPGGEYRQDTYRPLARPSTPANPSGVGSTYQTTVWATPGVVIDSVTVNGVRQYANQLGDFRTAAMSGSLLTDTGRSPEVVVNVRNVSPHAEGTLSGSQWVRGQLRPKAPHAAAANAASGIMIVPGVSVAPPNPHRAATLAAVRIEADRASFLASLSARDRIAYDAMQEGTPSIQTDWSTASDLLGRSATNLAIPVLTEFASIKAAGAIAGLMFDHGESLPARLEFLSDPKLVGRYAGKFGAHAPPFISVGLAVGSQARESGFVSFETGISAANSIAADAIGGMALIITAPAAVVSPNIPLIAASVVSALAEMAVESFSGWAGERLGNLIYDATYQKSRFCWISDSC